MAKDFIHIKGARSNNLKNIDLKIPKEQLVVVTGLSGSGKSSLVMDTLYAEGQRRYVESLSSYARQFLMRMRKPEIDFIHGLSPAIAIEQKTGSRNARSTVGSLTEIYDFLRLLYARIGKTISPISGNPVKKHQVADVIDYLKSREENEKWLIFIPLKAHEGKKLSEELKFLIQRGFTRIWLNNQLVHIQDYLESKDKKLKLSLDKIEQDKILILIDRIITRKEDEENTKRIADSVLTAFVESAGLCVLKRHNSEDEITFNNRFELDGMTFVEPTPQLFNYNNPFGACPMCEGYGRIMGIDKKKIIPNETLSIAEEVVLCWKGEKSRKWLDNILANAHAVDLPIHVPYASLSKKHRKMLWEGTKFFKGISAYFKMLEKETYKIQNRILLARYRGKTSCPECGGSRLRKEAGYVYIQNNNLSQLVDKPIDELHAYFKNMHLQGNDEKIGKRLLYEINNRLQTMMDVGLGYLSLDRLAATLSGGETQRINLTRTLGSNLTSSMYILDEPSIGLHPRDTRNLVKVLKHLRDLGNTVIVVEHEEEIIRNADFLIDMGPKAGIHGGEVIFADSAEKIPNSTSEALTIQYLNNKKRVELPESIRPIINKLIVKGARQHNLKNIDVVIPLNMITVITGVSGSGKSTLINDILYPSLQQKILNFTKRTLGAFDGLEGDISAITQVEYISQNPIGRSSRSNPITYVKAYDAIRKLMAGQRLSKIRGYQPKHFSFNVDGGRCETCSGEGETTVDMQFMADIKLLCETCQGKRFKKEVLDIRFQGKNIYEILNLSIEEALIFFNEQKDIVQKISPLFNVGLGYIRLGQSSSTLSGGEAQRVKLASFLGKERSSERILFLFDEPTTGLHFHDIHRLLYAFNALVEKGHSVVVVEHNMDIIKTADWVIDLGPEGGDLGGHLVFAGTPKDLAQCKASYTGQYLKSVFKRMGVN